MINTSNQDKKTLHCRLLVKHQKGTQDIWDQVNTKMEGAGFIKVQCKKARVQDAKPIVSGFFAFSISKSANLRDLTRSIDQAIVDHKRQDTPQFYLENRQIEREKQQTNANGQFVRRQTTGFELMAIHFLSKPEEAEDLQDLMRFIFSPERSLREVPHHVSYEVVADIAEPTALNTPGTLNRWGIKVAGHIMIAADAYNGVPASYETIETQCIVDLDIGHPECDDITMRQIVMGVELKNKRGRKLYLQVDHKATDRSSVVATFRAADRTEARQVFQMLYLAVRSLYPKCGKYFTPGTRAKTKERYTQDANGLWQHKSEMEYDSQARFHDNTLDERGLETLEHLTVLSFRPSRTNRQCNRKLEIHI